MRFCWLNNPLLGNTVALPGNGVDLQRHGGGNFLGLVEFFAFPRSAWWLSHDDEA